MDKVYLAVELRCAGLEVSEAGFYGLKIVDKTGWKISELREDEDGQVDAFRMTRNGAWDLVEVIDYCPARAPRVWFGDVVDGFGSGSSIGVGDRWSDLWVAIDEVGEALEAAEEAAWEAAQSDEEDCA
jgi:hypothetical protein